MNMENLEAKTTVFGAKASSTLVTMGNLISVLMDAGKLDDALSILKEFIADVIETFGKGSLNYCRTQRRLVEVLNLMKTCL